MSLTPEQYEELKAELAEVAGMMRELGARIDAVNQVVESAQARSAGSGGRGVPGPAVDSASGRAGNLQSGEEGEGG